MVQILTAIECMKDVFLKGVSDALSTHSAGTEDEEVEEDEDADDLGDLSS
jgi:hypothetical protein